jgi:hypothetical protein
MMLRRSFVVGLMSLFGQSAVKSQENADRLPPVPKWQPSFSQPLAQLIDRMTYYTDRKRDFAVFRNGTCVILDEGLSDEEAHQFALKTLSDILHYHPDMHPTAMDDGNILVGYNHPAANVVLREVAEAHWDEIESRYLDGLTPHEVLITPLGANKFDAFGKLALRAGLHVHGRAIAIACSDQAAPLVF